MVSVARFTRRRSSLRATGLSAAARTALMGTSVWLMAPVGEDELEPLAAGQLAHLDPEAPVDRPGHLGDDAPDLVPLVRHGVCDQLSGRRGGLSTVALAPSGSGMI